MTKGTVEDFQDDFALLIEAGFIAVKQLDETSASRIFKAAQVLNKESAAPQIGLGYIALNKLEVKEATKIFEDVLKKEPENQLAKTFLGICFLLTKPKRERGEELIKEAMDNTEDSTVKSLGKISLEWADKDLQKNKPHYFSGAESPEKMREKKE